MTASERLTVTCRLCGTAATFAPDEALGALDAVRCPQCAGPLLRVRGEPLTDLDDAALAHPWDREALARLRAIPMLDAVIGAVLGSTYDQLHRFELMASGLRVSERQLPHLHRAYLEAAGRLDVDPPPLFIVQSPEVNAWTRGAREPVVAISSAAVELLPVESLVGVFGHELTHVRLGHVLYRTLAQLLAQGALRVLKMMGLANLALAPLKLLLLQWSQMSELSADRGELLATGSLETHVRTAALLAGGSRALAQAIDVGAFVEQAHEADALRRDELFVNLMELVGGRDRPHPLNVWRVHHALSWARTPGFFQLLAGPHRLSLPSP